MAAPARLIIDTDPGIDDALALALAVTSPEVDLLGVTTVAGNAPVEEATDNALRLLRALGRDDVPVAAGANRALVRIGMHNQPSPHGENGLGGVELPAPTRSLSKEHAVGLLASALREAAPRSVTIAAIGPLTNIALLVAMHPELIDRIDKLVIMGGSTGRGNITPVAEFNIWSDPEAAQRVFACPHLETWLLGLDVTRRSTLDEKALAMLEARSHTGSLLATMIRGYGDIQADGWPMHDALVIAAIVDPSIVRLQTAAVEVETGVGVGRGQTVCTLSGSVTTSGGCATPGTRLAVDLDVARFRDLVITRVAGLAVAPA
ncbi:nucleoside hydrolase [Rhodococcus sp. NPDC056960]|uniref:nucleoside hydrolase n=1 Tax=Rhodococcus sp. NPDC056960 TaxID=3345982 RepID=UPI0036392939